MQIYGSSYASLEYYPYKMPSYVLASILAYTFLLGVDQLDLPLHNSNLIIFNHFNMYN